MLKGILVYILEIILTLDKMQNTSTLMCKKFETCGQLILKVVQAFHTVRIILKFGCSGPVIVSSTIYILIILRRSTSGTMPLTTQIWGAASNWRATPQ